MYTVLLFQISVIDEPTNTGPPTTEFDQPAPPTTEFGQPASATVEFDQPTSDIDPPTSLSLIITDLSEYAHEFAYITSTPATVNSENCNICQEDVFIACPHCLVFLCHGHAETECMEHNTLLQVNAISISPLPEISEQNLPSQVSEISISLPPEISDSLEQMHHEAKAASNTKKVKRKGQSRKERMEMKEMKDKGESYTNRKGQQKDGRDMKEAVCKDGCKEKIEHDQRQRLFKQFYSLSPDGQDQFICGCIEENEVKRRRVPVSMDSQRNISRSFFFTVGEEKIRVCKSFFLKTFGISDSRIRTLSKKQRISGVNIAIDDQRGRHINTKRITDEEK